jgi:RNA polymerase sigma factor for flagellar operon FliA
MSAGPSRGVGSLTEGLWHRYRQSADPVARAQLLDSYLGLVHFSAREVLRRGVRDIELDELVSAGTLGLVQALEGFDPARGLQFSTFAVPRIRGAMLDELRSRDWMPRSLRTRRRLLAKARADLENRLGRPPEEEEIAAALGIDAAACRRWLDETEARVMVALHPGASSDADETPRLAESIADTEAPAPDAHLLHRETLDEMRDAFAGLPEKERLVLALDYYEELNQKHIGEVLHVTESRVSQIRSRALRRLRVRVQGGSR